MSQTATRLREERERSGMSLEQIAEATGVSTQYLDAMESGSFDALPGRAFGKLYIRAYAQVLSFDPRPLIALYDDERRAPGGAGEPSRPTRAGMRPVAEAIARWRAARSDVEPDEIEEEEVAEIEAAIEEPVAEQTDEEIPLPVAVVDEPVSEPVEKAVPTMAPPIEMTEEPVLAPLDRPPVVRHVRAASVWEAVPRRWLLLAAALVGAVILVYFMVSGGDAAPEPAKGLPPVEARTPAVVETKAPPPASSLPTAPPKTRSAPAPNPPGPPSDLSISESGLGRRVVSSRLQGESDTFTEGDVVNFQTRVLGGKRGDTIRHVWIFEGRAQQSITLRVNAADYRTHSAKTVYKAGSWTVEARDSSGRVLARAAFTCAKR